jgi:periplasmic protein CpxP/Spy
MMKAKHSALLLAATLLTAPALVSAAHHEADGQPGAHEARKAHMKKGCEGERRGMKGHWGMKERGHHGQNYHGQRHHDMMGGKMMDPARFEQHLNKRLEKLDSPELKAQFLATRKASLTAMEQQMLLHKLMAEHKADKIENAELKVATLEKIAADSKVKQLRLKLMKETLNKLN